MIRCHFFLPEQVETSLKIYRTIETILLFSAVWDPNMLNKMLAHHKQFFNEIYQGTWI